MSKKNTKPKKIEPSSQETLKINTQFGEVEIKSDQCINLSHGLIGMPEFKKFNLLDVPNSKFEGFKLLQCLDDTSLSFLTLPIDLHNKIIDHQDLVEASNFIGIKVENLVILLIASTKMVNDVKKLIVNARAPIFVDSLSREATQYVLQNTKYDIQFVLE